MNNSREVVVTADSSAETWSAAVWDPLTGSLLFTYKNATALGRHTLQVVAGTYIMAADLTKPRLHLWYLNSQSPVANLRLTTPGKVSALACAPSGSYAAGSVGEKIFVWQLSSGKLVGTAARHYQTVTCLTFGQDGANLASGGEDGLIFVWSLTRLVTSREQSGPIHSFSDHSLPVKDLHYGNFSNNARLVSVSLDRTARIYDTNAGILLLTLVFDVPLTSVCMDVLENNLYVGSSSGSIMSFDLREPPRGHEYHVASDKETGNPVYRGHTGTVTTLSVSTDCRTLLSGSADSLVNFWDIPSRQIVRTLAHKGPITFASFIPDHENFRASSIRPKIHVRPLQRIADESGKHELIEILTCRDDRDFLNPDTYLDKNFETFEETSESEDSLAEARKQIDILKAKNSELYKFALKAFTSKTEAAKKSI